MKDVESGGDSCRWRQAGWVPPVAAETFDSNSRPVLWLMKKPHGEKRKKRRTKNEVIKKRKKENRS